MRKSLFKKYFIVMMLIVVISFVALGGLFATVSERYWINERRALLIIFISVLFMVALIFIAVYAVTYQMARPLRAMAAAARAMAKGDFTQRIPPGSGDEIGELADAFHYMSKSLASLEQLRRSFIGNVSHELKTPMTTIAGFIDGILDGTIAQEEQTKYLSIVSAEVKRLSRVVSSMLSLARLESGEMKLSLSPVVVSEILVHVTLTFEQMINEKNLEIRGLDDIPPIHVTADPDLLYQVIYNLLDNAVKYTPVGGYIEFKLKETADSVKVTIKNSGPGLTKQETVRIFERFYKVDRSRGLDKSSTGLGLYLVKTILEIHGGSVEVDSVLGEYTAFSFTLPT